MPILLDACKEEDFPRLAEVFSLSLSQDHPLTNAVYPTHWTSAGQRDLTKRLLEQHKTDSSATFLKVIDPEIDGGKIIGWAKWVVFQNTIPPRAELDGPWWDDGKGDKEHAQKFFNGLMIGRRSALEKSKGNLAVLDKMCVDPSHQRQGVGKLLMAWGVEIADRYDVEAIVEASNPGKGLYEAFGFKAIRLERVVPGEPWAHLGTQAFWYMSRPRKSDGTLLAVAED